MDMAADGGVRCLTTLCMACIAVVTREEQAALMPAVKEMLATIKKPAQLAELSLAHTARMRSRTGSRVNRAVGGLHRLVQSQLSHKRFG